MSVTYGATGDQVNIQSGAVTVISTVSGQTEIKLPNAPNSGDSNTLDCYAEGTYTVLDGSGAGLSLTQNMVAKYTRVGRNVTFMFDVTYPASVGTYGGLPAQIALPFVITPTNLGGMCVIYSGVSARYGVCYGANLLLFVYGSGTQTTNSAMANVQIICGGTYII